MSYNGPDGIYVTEEMKKELKTKNDCFQMIVDIAADYDGYVTLGGLKGLIDEMAAYASYGRKLTDA